MPITIQVMGFASSAAVVAPMAGSMAQKASAALRTPATMPTMEPLRFVHCWPSRVVDAPVAALLAASRACSARILAKIVPMRRKGALSTVQAKPRAYVARERVNSEPMPISTTRESTGNACTKELTLLVSTVRLSAELRRAGESTSPMEMAKSDMALPRMTKEPLVLSSMRVATFLANPS